MKELLRRIELAEIKEKTAYALLEKLAKETEEEAEQELKLKEPKRKRPSKTCSVSPKDQLLPRLFSRRQILWAMTTGVWTLRKMLLYLLVARDLRPRPRLLY